MDKIKHQVFLKSLSSLVYHYCLSKKARPLDSVPFKYVRAHEAVMLTLFVTLFCFLSVVVDAQKRPAIGSRPGTLKAAAIWTAAPTVCSNTTVLGCGQPDLFCINKECLSINCEITSVISELVNPCPTYPYEPNHCYQGTCNAVTGKCGVTSCEHNGQVCVDNVCLPPPTNAPTGAPTHSPTNAPTTHFPTNAPTTQAPTSSPSGTGIAGAAIGLVVLVILICIIMCLIAAYRRRRDRRGQSNII